MLSTRPHERAASRVSVVIPTRDRPAHLRRCLDSLAQQTARPLEVIIVDDGHGSREELAPLCEQLTLPLVYIAKDTPGTCGSRNAGARLARGDFVLFLDDDVVLDPGYIEAVEAVFASDRAGEVLGVGGSMIEPVRAASLFARVLFRTLRVAFLIESPRAGRVLPSGFRTHLKSTKTERDVEILSTSNSCYRRSVFESVLFDPAYERSSGYAFGEDVDFSYRVSRRGRLRVIPHARGRHDLAPPHFLSRARLETLYIVHHYHFLRRTIGMTPGRFLAFNWALCGTILCDLLALAFRPTRENSELMRSHFAGIFLVISGRSESPVREREPGAVTT